jgi:hypothetical protein
MPSPLQDSEQSPLQDSSSVRQKGVLLGPPLIPDPESLAAQAAYSEALLPGSAPARIVSRHWGPRTVLTLSATESR